MPLMAGFPLKNEPHRRYNPLNGTWVLVSPHRTKRPWQGQQEAISEFRRPSYDPQCYLCPGNRRAGGRRNPLYRSTFAFDNDFPALRPRSRGKMIDDLRMTIDDCENEADLSGSIVNRRSSIVNRTEAPSSKTSAILKAMPERGVCRVLCFSPRHDLSLAQMTVNEVLRVVEAWMEQHRDLARRPYVNHVQIFENKGEMMGCSNPHPHGQIWAQERIPLLAQQESNCQSSYFNRNHRCLLCDYLELELRLKERIVCDNEDFAVFVPFWAVWPFETLLLGKEHRSSLTDLRVRERRSLARVLRETTARYDNLFRISFPYSMGWHQAPGDTRIQPVHHLHAHFYPPLLRSASIRKFMVGYEMLAEPQRDITAETSARQLREQPPERFQA